MRPGTTIVLAAALSAGCGSNSKLPPEPPPDPPPSTPASSPEVERARKCLLRAGADSWAVEERPLGGSRGTLRADYGEFQVQIAFARNAKEARGIARRAVDVATAVGAEGAEDFVRVWHDVAVSWGAAPPTPAAVRFVKRCVAR